jgi:hypothetical protein
LRHRSTWVYLYHRYGKESRFPSDGELAQAVAELFEENLDSMTEADYTAHPNAWLRYGFDEGPMLVVSANRDATVTLSKYADQDDSVPEIECTVKDLPREKLLLLWTWLARGELERIRAEHPGCGW